MFASLIAITGKAKPLRSAPSSRILIASRSIKTLPFFYSSSQLCSSKVSEAYPASCSRERKMSSRPSFTVNPNSRRMYLICHHRPLIHTTNRKPDPSSPDIYSPIFNSISPTSSHHGKPWSISPVNLKSACAQPLLSVQPACFRIPSRIAVSLPAYHRGK